jgi:hypothetical protein
MTEFEEEEEESLDNNSVDCEDQNDGIYDFRNCDSFDWICGHEHHHDINNGINIEMPEGKTQPVKKAGNLTGDKK